MPRPLSRGPSPAPQGYGGAPTSYGAPTYGAPIARPVSRGPSPAPYTYAGAPIARSISRGPSPAPPGIGRPDNSRHPSTSDFQVEKRAKSPNPYGRPSVSQTEIPYRDEALYREHVSVLIATKDTQFAVNGRIPVDPAQLVLFFRAKTGITHSLDFPIDISYNTPPALDVLIAACRPHPRSGSDYDTYGSREGLFYPPNLPLTASLDISNFPILDAIRNSLFPLLPPGEYLAAVKDGLDVIQPGSSTAAHSPALLRNDQRAGTIIITLPIRYRGGAMDIRDADGRTEKFQGTGGKTGDIEWIAFRSDCDYEVEPVQKGCLMTLSYAIYIKSFGPASPSLDTLITPSDTFFDLLSPILNMSRGRSVGFYLNHDYGVNPAEAAANALIPQLKGADALIYTAFKLHKLAPELHWTAGGYVWAKDQSLEFFGDDAGRPQSTNPVKNSPLLARTPFGAANSPRGTPPVRGTFGQYPGDPNYDEQDVDVIRSRVQGSGAVTLADAGITLLTDFKNLAPTVGRERVYFVANNELEKLVVNALLVVYIP
ncbi:hypothetical protein BDZ97DRAFT_1658482 [Flammula alnicola]|nr:hypothetical protein BDZ97DRAFT_1658482 [Flammula alnicola]